MANYINDITLNEAIVKAAIKQKDYVDTNFQKKSDDTLLTEDKTLVGAINELSQKSGIDKVLLETITSEVQTIKTEVHTIQETVDSNEDEISNVIELINEKADLKDVYTKEETENLIKNIGLENYVTKEQFSPIEEELKGLPSVYLSQDKADATYDHIKYEIVSVPTGTLVDYREKEIRVMCPATTQWTKQNVGSTGNANMYYMGFKAYAPKGAVSFKEGDRGIIDDEMFTFDNDFAGTDEFGRNYSICWLPLASYDAGSDTWTYFGKNSSAKKYIGWTYIVEWYDADGVVIASDMIRINLSNEDCHNAIEPYYANSIVESANAYTDAQIKSKIPEVYGIEIVEF